MFQHGSNSTVAEYQACRWA